MRRLIPLLIAAVVPGMSCSFNPEDLQALPDASADVATSPETSVGDLSNVDAESLDQAPIDVCEAGLDASYDEATPAPDAPMSIDTGADEPAAGVDAPLVCDADPGIVDGDNGSIDADEACAPGTKRCSGTALEICDEDSNWNPTVVRKDICGAECSPGESPDDCDGRTPRTCGRDGKWQAQAICDYVCKAGACAGECLPGTARCNGKIPQSCSDDGTWKDGPACERVCEGAGKCGGVCNPNDTQCAGTTPRVCGADGVWVDGPVTQNLCGAVCQPSTTRACGNCGLGTETCTPAGMWGGCQNTAGTEVTYYRDGDGDGYGTSADTKKSCTGAPTGYVSNNLDCCDTDSRVRPSQTGYSSSTNDCGNWDYNCDGHETPAYGQVQCCDCSSSSSYACPSAACGKPITTYTCDRNTYASTCKSVSSAGPAQTCR